MTGFQHPPLQEEIIPEPLGVCAKLVAVRDGRKEGDVITSK